MRALRQRERAGRILLRLEVDEAALVVGLIDGGFLAPLQGDNRGAITAATERALAKFLDGGEVSRQQERIRDTLALKLLLSALRKKVVSHAAPKR